MKEYRTTMQAAAKASERGKSGLVEVFVKQGEQLLEAAKQFEQDPR